MTGADSSGARIRQTSPRFVARLAGAFYLLNIATSLVAFSGKGNHWLIVSSGMLATASYITVTALLYWLFKPVQPLLSLIAAIFSWAGCLNGLLQSRHLLLIHVHSLVFFGAYCLLIGLLILRSAFLPKFLGALMMLAGLGWLTFISPPLARSLSPWHYIMGGVGESLFTLWLLFVGVDALKWKQQSFLSGAQVR